AENPLSRGIGSTQYIKNRMEGARQSQCASLSGAPLGASLAERGAVSAGLAVAAGLAVRLWMLHWAFEVNGDSLVYGGIAKNLLLHGRYALSANGILYPTLLRLPGYPLFLAACFRLFGIENYYAAACVQIGLELAGCLLLAGFASRAARMVRGADAGLARRAGLATLWLAALCPFTAAYAVEPLAEAPTLFLLALAMGSMAAFQERPAWPSGLLFTLAVTAAALLRPDGALAAVAFAPAMFRAALGCRGGLESIGARLRPLDAGRAVSGAAAAKQASLRRLMAVCILLAVTPFAAWTWRNWRVFHLLQPLAPRLATDPGESPNPGWERWVKTWCLDFNSTYNIYWNVPGDVLDVRALPARAFDSDAEFAATVALARDYNTQGEKLSPVLDARFAALARARIAAHPLRYYLWLPLGRLADMGLRPRVENLPIDLDWWVYAHHRRETVLSWGFAALNAGYILLAGFGLWLRPRFWKALLAYLVLRSLLLLTVEAPEARYTLEFFPMLTALAGIAVAAATRGRRPAA
ncbi:MAG: hypothetical protein ACLGSH_07220, partial [Acidobacteriota bacterium]